jgi:hypothetical protein
MLMNVVFEFPHRGISLKISGREPPYNRRFDYQSRGLLGLVGLNPTRSVQS